MPIITSLLDTDFYKLSVQSVFFHNFSHLDAEYSFTCRNLGIDLLKYVPEDELSEQIFEHLPKLALTVEEYGYLIWTGYFKETYLQYLQNFRFNPSRHITVTRDNEKRTYNIVAKGPLVAIMFYETMILSIVNEIFEKNYCKDNGGIEQAIADGKMRLRRKQEKLAIYNEECELRGVAIPQLVEFGSRRRFSKEFHSFVLNELIKCKTNCIGTSNVHLAMSKGTVAIGTQGHEYFMAFQSVFSPHRSQVEALRMWLREYQGNLGIALTDTLGDERFFHDFTLEFANAFTGVRHDSGDPFAYGERIIAMYQGYGIDPTTKKIVFSDGLDFDVMIALHKQFVGRIDLSFGIGTFLSNDCGTPVPQIVFKMTKCNNQDVAKLSNNPAKASCRNSLYLEYLRMAAKEY